MAPPQPARTEEDASGEERRSEQLKSAIAASVLRALGSPSNLLRVAVVRLWANRYRVNVQTGPDAASARVAHSYFLEADEGGEVTVSDPVIARVY